MKKLISILLVIAYVFGLCSCGKTSNFDLQFESSQIMSICNIATLDCYYNNVVTMNKEKGTGLQHILEHNNEYWLEYSGVVTFGIDSSKIQVESNGTEIIISMPEAVILRVTVDDDTDFNFYSDEGNFVQKTLNTNKITSEERTQMAAYAQEDMLNKAQSNTQLFQVAETRAKELIEEYINNIGELSGVEYSIVWENL